MIGLEPMSSVHCATTTVNRNNIEHVFEHLSLKSNNF